MKSKWTHVPRWVAVLHAILEFLDYRIADPISRYLSCTRMNLIEDHCWCDRCVERHPERAVWRQP